MQHNDITFLQLGIIIHMKQADYYFTCPVIWTSSGSSGIPNFWLGATVSKAIDTKKNPEHDLAIKTSANYHVKTGDAHVKKW